MEINYHKQISEALRVLLLPHGSTAKQIDQAYRRLVLLHHPDKGGDAEKFQEVHHARDLLLEGGNANFEQDNIPNDPMENSVTVGNDFHILRSQGCVRSMAYCTIYGAVAVATDGINGLQVIVPIQGKREIFQMSTTCSYRNENHLLNNHVRQKQTISTCVAISSVGLLYAGDDKGNIHQYCLCPSCLSFQTSSSSTKKDPKLSWSPSRVEQIDKWQTSKIMAISTLTEGQSSTHTMTTTFSQCSGDKSCYNKSNKYHNLVVAATVNPTSIILLNFLKEKVHILWEIGNHNRSIDILQLIEIPETILITRAYEARSSSAKGIDSTCDENEMLFTSVWVGGSQGSDGSLIVWDLTFSKDDLVKNIDITLEESDYYEVHSDYASDSSSASGSICIKHNNLPVIQKKMDSGPIYSIDNNERQVAITSGSNVYIFQRNLLAEQHTQCMYDGRKGESGKIMVEGYNDRCTKLFMTQHFHTFQILYSVALSSSHVAAAGAAETIIVWSLRYGTVISCFKLNTIKTCNLHTSCILSLLLVNNNAYTNTGEKILKENVLLSGGYDGNVTRWILNFSNPNEKNLQI